MTNLFAPTVNCARTTVTTPPSPTETGTTMVIPKITLPTVTAAVVTERPFAETFRATIAPIGEAPTQSNSEIVEVTKVEEEADKEHYKLTIVRKVEGPMGARAVQVGDLFEVSITAGMLNPGPWQNCRLGPKIIESGETPQIPTVQIRWLSYIWSLIQMRGKVETNKEEIKANTDEVIEIPEGFGAGTLQFTPRIPMFTKTWSAKLGADLEESTVVAPMQTTLKPASLGSRIYVSQVTIPGPSKVDLSFDSTFTGPWI